MIVPHFLRRRQLESARNDAGHGDGLVQFLPAEGAAVQFDLNLAQLFVRSTRQDSKPIRGKSDKPPVMQLDIDHPSLGPGPQGGRLDSCGVRQMRSCIHQFIAPLWGLFSLGAPYPGLRPALPSRPPTGLQLIPSSSLGRFISGLWPFGSCRFATPWALRGPSKLSTRLSLNLNPPKDVPALGTASL